MPDKQILKHFFLGFFSVLGLGAIQLEKSGDRDITEYFCKTEQDLLLAYEKLRKTYERN